MVLYPAVAWLCANKGFDLFPSGRRSRNFTITFAGPKERALRNPFDFTTKED